ncbi:MAG: heat shock protein HspQ [Pirellulales bacterium]
MIAIATEKPKFQPGELVFHKRYNYRGVIVAVDRVCLAGERWYDSNRTQPARNQPWYHVLVDGTDGTTYVAQSNLRPDDRLDPVEHPLVDQFFDDFDGERYERNDREWPGW